MDALTPRVNSETANLTHVVIGLPDTFHRSNPEIINQTQQRFYYTEDHPEREKLILELAEFRNLLEHHGVEVYQPATVEGVPDQLTPRDIGFVIGDTLVLSNMANRSRRMEWRGLQKMIRQLDTPVVHLPESLTIEGGDVIVHEGVIYVGISERTSQDTADYLAQTFPQYEVMAVPLRSSDSAQEILHLDCTFLPVGNEHALIYPEGLAEVPAAINDRFDLIKVMSEEQQDLAVNVLSLSPRIVVSRSRAKRVNARLRNIGFQVIEIEFDEAPKTGGSL